MGQSNYAKKITDYVTCIACDYDQYVLKLKNIKSIYVRCGNKIKKKKTI